MVFRPDDLARIRLPKDALIATWILQWLTCPRLAVPVRVRSILGGLVDRYAGDVDPVAITAKAVDETIILAFDRGKVTIVGVDARVP